MSKDASSSITAAINVGRAMISFALKVSSSYAKSNRSDEVACMAINLLCCINTLHLIRKRTVHVLFSLSQSLSMFISANLLIQCGNHLNILID